MQKVTNIAGTPVWWPKPPSDVPISSKNDQPKLKMETAVVKVVFYSYIFQDTFGFNLAGLKYLQNELKQRQSVELFTEAVNLNKQKKKKRKKKEAALRRAIITLK